MSTRAGGRFFALVILFFLTVEMGKSQDPKAVEVHVVRYGELAELIQKHRGKVVLVDFWATFCPPCVKELPHLVQMHSKYSPQGLVTITVSLDQIKKDPEIKQKVLQHLHKAGAKTINVILDEDFEFVMKKLRCDGLPCAFVFNRQGKWANFQEEKFRHDLIEQTVIQFLKAK